MSAGWDLVKATGNGKLEYRLQIEGFPYEFVTNDQLIPTLVSAIPPSPTRVNGLKRESLQFEHKTNWLTAKLDSGQMTFKFVDYNGAATRAFVRNPTYEQQLTQSLNSGSSQIHTVQSDFYNNGQLGFIGTEMFYSIGTSGSGYFNAQRNDVSQGWFGNNMNYHINDANILGTLPTYYITDVPIRISERRVILYVYNMDVDDPTGNGTAIWRGITKSEVELDDIGTYKLSCNSIADKLIQNIGGDFGDSLKPRGFYFPNGYELVYFIYENADENQPDNVSLITINTANSFIVSGSGFFETKEDLIDALNTQLTDNLTEYQSTLGWTTAAMNFAFNGQKLNFNWTTDSIDPRWVSCGVINGPCLAVRSDSFLSDDPTIIVDYDRRRRTDPIVRKPLTCFQIANFQDRLTGRITQTTNEDGRSVDLVAVDAVFSSPAVENIPEAIAPIFERHANSRLPDYFAFDAGATSNPVDPLFYFSIWSADYINVDWPMNRFYYSSPTLQASSISLNPPRELDGYEDTQIPASLTILENNEADRYALLEGPDFPVLTWNFTDESDFTISTSFPGIEYTEAVHGFDGERNHLGIFISSSLIPASREWSTLGIMPNLSPDDFDLASIDTLFQSLHPSGTETGFNTRLYQYGIKSVPLQDIVAEECKLNNIYPIINETSKISFAKLRDPSLTEIALITLSSSVLKPFPGFSRQQTRVVNYGEYTEPYNPFEEDNNKDKYSFTAVDSVAQFGGKRGKYELNPYSNSRIPLTYDQILSMLQKPISVFSVPRTEITTEVGLNYFDTNIGDLVRLVSPYVPNAMTGRRAIDTVGFVRGVAWDMNQGKGKLTVSLLDRPLVGYSPNMRIESVEDDVNPVFSLTIKQNDFAPAPFDDYNYFFTNDIVEVWLPNEWNDLPLQATASITDGSNTSLTLTFPAAISAGRASALSSSIVGFPPFTGTLTEYQSKFCFVSPNTFTSYLGKFGA